jgi:hypothetical protein
VDWKTGKSIYKEAHLQNAAYREAIMEMGIVSDHPCIATGLRPLGGLILRLPKTEADPDFEAVIAHEQEKSFTTFLTAKRLWEDMQEEKTPAEVCEKVAAG